MTKALGGWASTYVFLPTLDTHCFPQVIWRQQTASRGPQAHHPVSGLFALVHQVTTTWNALPHFPTHFSRVQELLFISTCSIDLTSASSLEYLPKCLPGGRDPPPCFHSLYVGTHTLPCTGHKTQTQTHSHIHTPMPPTHACSLHPT